MAIIEEIYFALPIYVANMMPVFARQLSFLNYPINKDLFGENKTVRGFLSAIAAAIIFESPQEMSDHHQSERI